MTLLQAYVVFGIPAILVGMGYAALKWADRESRLYDERKARAEARPIG